MLKARIDRKMSREEDPSTLQRNLS
jgi:hypothetical protein